MPKTYFCLALLLAATPFAALAQAQQGPAVVEIAPIVQKEIAGAEPVVGSVTPTRRAIIGSAVDGRVVEFLVREGDRVQKDQPLASLLTQTIELELAAAVAELDLRQQELDELKNGNRPDEIAQAKARLEATQIAVEYLQKNKDRMLELTERSAASETDRDNALSLWLEAQQRNLEAKSAYQLMVEGARPEKIKQAEARVAANKAIVERLRDQLAKHTIYSRFAGYVTRELTEVGQWLPRGEPVAEVIALDEVFVVAKVMEDQIPFIHVKDPVKVQIMALGSTPFEGTVEAIVPEADTRSRTFPVKIRVKNELSEDGQPKIKAGMLARAYLRSSQSHQAWLVHKDALVLNGRNTMIYAVDMGAVEEGKTQTGFPVMMQSNVIALPVTTGTEEGNMIEVLGELRPNLAAVIRGNERIQPPRPGSPPTRVTWPKPTEPTAK